MGGQVVVAKLNESCHIRHPNLNNTCLFKNNQQLFYSKQVQTYDYSGY